MTAPRKFRKKPVVIEAIQFDGSWSDAVTIMKWADSIYFVNAGFEHPLRREAEHDPSNGGVYADRAPQFLVVRTLEGDMRADCGDWIIRGIQGEFYPCKPDIFGATYEAVES